MLKAKNGKYYIEYQGKNIRIYEETIIKLNLLTSKDIDKEKIIAVNQYYDYLNKALNYLEALRSKKDVAIYLNKKGASSKDIASIIKYLESINLLNDEVYAKAFINDQKNINGDGPYKIKYKLLNKGIDEALIDKLLLSYEDDEEMIKINNLINKYKKANRNKSSYLLKKSIEVKLFNKGFSKELISSALNNFTYDDTLIKEAETAKIRRKLKSKDNINIDEEVKKKLYQKGFKD